MKKIKNLLLVSYIKNKGIRRLLFVSSIIFAFIVFNDSYGLEKLGCIIVSEYLFFFVACIIKWIISGFKESKKQK